MDAASNWFNTWTTQYGDFPDSYLVIDTESTGSDIKQDYLIQLGWCKVENQQVVDNSQITLNWDKSPFVDTNWLRKRMDSTADQMEEKFQKTYPWRYTELLQGEKPVVALSRFLDILSDAADSDTLIVAHNGVCFDIPVISSHFRKYLKIPYQFDFSSIWDTGAMEKASQINEMLCENELSGDFAYRVVTRSNDSVRWSLHEHCIFKYNLDRFNLDLSKSHTAPFDAYVTHLLFEEFRHIACS
jgi:DNA polymerase III epsilon subunit-like protein